MKILFRCFPFMLPVVLAACETGLPADFEDAAGFELVSEIMNSPMDGATIARLNMALGRDPGAAVQLVGGPLNAGRAFVTDGTGDGFWATLVDASQGDDVVCSFRDGGSVADFHEFLACRPENGDFDLSIPHEIRTSNGTGVLKITELQVIRRHL